MFGFPKERSFSVVDNRACSLQRRGKYSVSRNIFSANDIINLYMSQSLSKDTPARLLTNLIFSVGTMSAMGPGALVTLTHTQLMKQEVQGMNV